VSENPYQTPASDAVPAERPSFRLHWYHVPFIVAVVCVIALVIAYNIVPRDARLAKPGLDFFAICFGIIGAISVFDLAVCGWILWQWWRTGEPPQLSLEPLFDSAETRALYRAWRERPQLDDDAFYDKCYADSGIAKQVVSDVRREMQNILGRSLDGIHPADDLETAAPELDFADVFYRFEKDLHIVIPWRTTKIDFDFTFDSLVRLIADCMANKYPVPPPIERQPFTVRVRHLPIAIAIVCMATLLITSNITFRDPDDAVIWVSIPTIIFVLDVPLCLWILRRL
jgi:hypothetical protein